MSKELIERLEKVEFGSQELDAEICVFFQYGGPLSEGAKDVRTDPDWEGDLLFEQGADECCNPIPEVTTSLDAALALAERVLPADPDFRPATPSAGWKIDIYRGMVPTADGGGWFVTVRQHATDGFQAAKSSPALALCIAILKAQGAQQ